MVTCREFHDKVAEDKLLQQAFVDAHIAADRVSWDDDSVKWDQFAMLIIRTTWNYTWHYEEFFGWLRRLEFLKIPLWNPPRVLRWNSSKKYLIELADHGIPIPQTEWLYESAPDFDAVLKELGWKQAVVKPIVSAGGRDTHLIGTAEGERWQTQLKHAARSHGKKAHAPRGGWMIQEFMPEIRSDGEWSLLFFGGEFSHAVIKRPRDGEFRVQERHGGSYEAAEPDGELIRQARAILSYVSEPLLYGRVDGVVRKGRLILMELELFEPAFFLEYAPGSEKRFVRTVEQRMES